MLKVILSFVTGFSFLSVTSLPSFAQDPYHFHDSHMNKPQMHAGVYFKLPLSGGLKKNKEDKLKFGASLGVRRDFMGNRNFMANQNISNIPRSFRADILDLKFNKQGFDALALSGQNILTYENGQVVYAGEDKENKDSAGKKIGKVALVGIGLVGVTVIIAGLALKDLESDIRDSVKRTLDGK